jgi:hypothetical protein
MAIPPEELFSALLLMSGWRRGRFAFNTDSPAITGKAALGAWSSYIKLCSRFQWLKILHLKFTLAGRDVLEVNSAGGRTACLDVAEIKQK